MTHSPRAQAAAAFVSDWLRAQLGPTWQFSADDELQLWRIERPPPGRAFVVGISEDALEQGEAWLEAQLQRLAKAAKNGASPAPPGYFSLSSRGLEVTDG